MVFRSWILKNFQKMKRKHLNFLRTTFSRKRKQGDQFA